MPKIVRYPRGYIAVLGTTGLADFLQTSKETATPVPFDEDVETLYKFFIERSVNTNAWAFRSRVIEAAARLFGDFRQWLILQSEGNDCVYDLNFAFLKDTVQFIRTGHREMSPLTWRELLLEHPPAKPGAANTQMRDELKLDDEKEFNDFISLWCSKEGGFEDMLCTVHVLYGSSKKPLDSPKS